MRVFIVLLLSTTLASAAEVRSKSGARTSVSSTYASKFQALISWLDSQGYPIKFLGGVRRGSCSQRSLHPCGKAIDINQVARGRVIKKFPPGTDAYARSLGLVSGSGWCNQDTGHFQVGGWSGCRVASRSRPVEQRTLKAYANVETREKE